MPESYDPVEHFKEQRKELARRILNWSESFRDNVQSQMSKAFFVAILSSSSIIEQFTTWLLAGIGATLALMSTNIADLMEFIRPERLKAGLVILVVGTLFGFLAKIKAVQIRIFLALEQSLTTAIDDVLKENEEEEGEIQEAAEKFTVDTNTDIDFVKTVEPFLESIPWWVKREKLIDALKKGAEDPLTAYKNHVRAYYLQIGYGVLQFVSVIIFTLLLVSGIQ